MGLILALPLISFLAIRALIRADKASTVSQRLGLIELPGSIGSNQPIIWLHAASVGEIQAASILIGELEDQFPRASFLLSTITEQGLNVARQQLGSRVFCFYAPLDLVIIVRRLLKKIKPTLYICIETELWPNLLIEAHAQGVKLALLNGRISDVSAKRYKKIQPLIKRTINCFDRISAISSNDSKRLIDLGADPNRVRILGNAKFSNNNHRKIGEGNRLRKKYSIHPNQPVLILGSTHGNEEEMLLPVHLALKEVSDNLVTIIAPRHLNRLVEVEKLLTERRIDYSMLSSIEDKKTRHNLILVDSMGNLGNLYAMADFIFCGGSLVAKGGHNVMEAAIWGKPVFYGPHMKDFAEAATMLENANASIPINSADDLTAGVKSLMADPDRYRKLSQQAAIVAKSQHDSARQQIKNITHLLKGSGN